ncbi:alpha/beta hydrolase family protein [Halovenus halobia]|uniref:alpha/beta hydrolase family protein n=1 Tax=Halovenus halobia TaxID=3396622 RepID=UPI003F57033E
MTQTRHEITVDGDQLVAVHHETDSDKLLVFCHGFVSDKEGSYERRCERAVAAGYDAVRFDFRGCGESDRSFGEQTLSTRIADLRAVLSAFEYPTVALFGSSFGASVAFHVGATEDIDAIAARAPVTYTRAFDRYRSDAGSPVVGPDDSFFTDLDAHPFEPTATEITVPVAIFHGREDESVPVTDSLDAAAVLSTDTTLELYAEEGHRFSETAEQRLCERLFPWLDRACG